MQEYLSAFIALILLILECNQGKDIDLSRWSLIGYAILRFRSNRKLRFVKKRFVTEWCYGLLRQMALPFYF
jgi:hypothetical protein